jgi:hypothetical protein
MSDTYLYLNSQDSIDIRKKNSPSDFWIQFPKVFSFEGDWVCGLREISFTCDFTPKTSRLYLCCDIVEESYVRGTLLPVLRNLEVQSHYQKLKFEDFTSPLYIRIKAVNLNTIRLYMVDEYLNPLEFKSNDLHCVLHLRKKWVP